MPYSSNGANLSFPVEFGIGHGETKGHPHQVRDSWLVGLVNAGPYIGSAFLGCWLSDPCNFYFGRRGTIFISAVFCLITPIGGAVSQTWEQLFITRILMGIGMGLKGSSVPIFAAENSPAKIRGALVMSWQMWTAFGRILLTKRESYLILTRNRYLLGILRQSCRIPSRSNRLEIADRLRLYSGSTTDYRNLLLRKGNSGRCSHTMLICSL